MGLFDLIAGAIVMKGVRDLLGGNSSSSFNSGGWNSRCDNGYDHYCDCCDDFHDDFDSDMFF